MTSDLGGIILSTSRLHLREISHADAPFILKLLNDPGYIKYIRDSQVRTLSEANTHIDKYYLQSYSNNGFGLYLVSLTDGTALGICGLVKREDLDFPDIGFAFLEEHCGKSYGFESASAVLKFAQTKLKLTTILGITSTENLASIALLKKLGLKFKEEIIKNGSPTMVFSL